MSEFTFVMLLLPKWRLVLGPGSNGLLAAEIGMGVGISVMPEDAM
jgi:hypothetical protein